MGKYTRGERSDFRRVANTRDLTKIAVVIHQYKELNFKFLRKYTGLTTDKLRDGLSFLLRYNIIKVDTRLKLGKIYRKKQHR